MLTLFCKQIDRKSPKSGGMNFSALLDAWLAETGSRVKRSTLATYERALGRCIRPALGALDTEQMTDAELTKFLTGAAEVYSGSTVRLLGCILRSALEYAHGRGLCRAAEGRLPRLSAARQEARILSREEQLRLLDSLSPEGAPDRLGILLCLYTGMRLGEACGLRWGDFSPDCNIIYIRRTLQRLAVHDGEHKTALVLDTPKSSSSITSLRSVSIMLQYLSYATITYASRQRGGVMVSGHMWRKIISRSFHVRLNMALALASAFLGCSKPCRRSPFRRR